MLQCSCCICVVFQIITTNFVTFNLSIKKQQPCKHESRLSRTSMSRVTFGTKTGRRWERVSAATLSVSVTRWAAVCQAAMTWAVASKQLAFLIAGKFRVAGSRGICSLQKVRTPALSSAITLKSARVVYPSWNTLCYALNGTSDSESTNCKSAPMLVTSATSTLVSATIRLSTKASVIQDT